jgi:hypothetical protein
MIGERVGFAILEVIMERRDDFFISEEVAEWIGLKKSEYISRLVLKASPDDIGVEDFHLFDSYIPGSIEKPDTIYESIEDHQRIRTYIKTYSEKVEFHQVVIGVVLDDKKHNSDIFIPILTFVSKKSELVKEFMSGAKILSPKFN